MKIRLALFSVFILALATTSFGQVSLPSVIADNMILQRNADVKLWGWASPGEVISVVPDWLDKGFNTTADSDGKWIATVPTGKAGGPHKIYFNASNKLEIKNILFGDIWICSGQSNMEYTIKMLGGWDHPLFAKDSRELSENDYSQIRLFNLENNTSDKPLDNCSGSWEEPVLENVETFSAVAWFFATQVYKSINVPIGLISTNWGGTPAEAWTSSRTFEGDPDLSYYNIDNLGKRAPQGTPSMLYNAMINPLLNFSIKGAIWYQGESNRNDAYHYRKLFPAMITDWRQSFNQGDFPFYYVQIAPYKYNESRSGALLREAQLMALSLPNTGMVVTTDIGNVDDIHPANKQEVGRRLALNALANTYGYDYMDYSGPILKSMEPSDNALMLSFSHDESGLMAKGESLTHFEIAGSDRSFYDATAIIIDNKLKVSSEEVKNPVAVRFGFGNIDEPNFFNMAGLPASPFRTDDWVINTVQVKIDTEVLPRNKYRVKMSCREDKAKIRYTLDGSLPDQSSKQYKKEFKISGNIKIRARTFIDGIGSEGVSELELLGHKASGKEISLVYPYSPRYTAGGKLGLLDGLRGSEEFTDGRWQGYEGMDFEATVDLGEKTDVEEAGVGFLFNTSSWIFLPVNIEILYSVNGKDFIHAKSWKKNPELDLEVKAKGKMNFSFKINQKAIRYIKLKVTNIGECPEWHPGAGGKAWIFIDEIIIK